MIGYDRFLSGRCPTCNVELEKEPRTVFQAGPDAAHRHAFENTRCPKCGEKYSRLVKERRPAGTG